MIVMMLLLIEIGLLVTGYTLASPGGTAFQRLVRKAVGSLQDLWEQWFGDCKQKEKNEWIASQTRMFAVERKRRREVKGVHVSVFICTESWMLPHFSMIRCSVDTIPQI